MVGVLPVREIINLCNDKMDVSARGEQNLLSVGSRVKCEDSIGTVLYVGEVSGYKGIWYGVDWDDAERGKHDGSMLGIKYFDASSPNSGSFVKPHKLLPTLSCAEAIKKYYGEKEDETTAALYKAVIEDWKRQIKVPFIEMIGFESMQEKQGSLDRLLEACVGDRCVNEGGDLSSLCPILHSLDLSRTLIPNWKTVANIARQLPYLKSLILQKNRIQIPPSDQEAENLSQYFTSLKKLCLTHCNMDWHQVSRVSLMLPHLEELILVCNRITTMATPQSGIANFSKLTSLVLDGNYLSDWNEVMKLGSLNSLRSLSLNDCQLKAIKIDEKCDGEKSSIFKNLEVLHLKFNLISDWRSISELDKLASLQKLYFIKNPLTEEEDYDTIYQLIVARIGNLKEMNGSELAKDARRGAEYDYLKRHGKVWKILSAGDQDITDFLLEHARFQKLVQKYGLPDDSLLEKKENTSLICTKLIEITLQDQLTGAAFKKRLPSTLTVQKLTALARRLFPSSRNTTPSLYCLYTALGSKEMTIPLENQLKGLDYYSVNTGDTVLIKWH